MRSSLIVLALLASACSGQQPADTPKGVQAVLPDAPDPTPHSRAYSLTESPDGQIRVFAQEQGDYTKMYEMRRADDGTWSDPVEMTFPTRAKLTEPGFSWSDGMLYYSSDIPLDGRETKSDANIWRVMPTETGWGEPELLSLTINTGASELSPRMDEQGRLYFTSNHSRGVGGHDIYEAHWDEAAGDWQIIDMPDGFNDARADAQLAITPDGDRMFFYSHRSPKLGVVDIWTAERDADGHWQMPVNLGEPVNTPGIDLGPGVSGDGQTLFFSREGRLMMIPMQEALAGIGSTNDTP